MKINKEIKNSIGYKRLGKEFPFFLVNLTNDKELAASEKKKFLDHLKAFDNISNFENHCLSYFRKKQLLGKKALSPELLNPYIRIIYQHKFYERISEITGIKYDKIKPLVKEISFARTAADRALLLRSFLDNIVLRKCYDGEANCLWYLGIKKWTAKAQPRLKEAKIEPFLQWSFPLPGEEKIFASQKAINLLDCRAGLIDNPGNKLSFKIVYSHSIPSSETVCKPTCFDAEFYPQFLPGGMTKPLKGCDKQTGFSEYIHGSNKYLGLKGEFYEISKK